MCICICIYIYIYIYIYIILRNETRDLRFTEIGWTILHHPTLAPGNLRIRRARRGEDGHQEERLMLYYIILYYIMLYYSIV